MPTQFGDFTLDESRRQLFGNAGEVHLSPKAFQLLSILIAVQPKAISKSELQEQLWPATFVSESNLAGVVAELRAALGDDARDPYLAALYCAIREIKVLGNSFGSCGVLSVTAQSALVDR